jgi:predicted transcriptional regulator of viral defense system
MPKPNRLLLAKEDILSLISLASQKVYAKAQLASMLLQNRRSWHLPEHTTVADFISFLAKHGDLRRNRLRSEAYGKEIIRYSWGKTSVLELAGSISPRGYLCHSTALMIHGLVESKPKVGPIYLNVEQSLKQSTNRSLTQDGIDRAFSGNQRQSNLIYKCNRVPVIMMAGKNTNRLGVEQKTGPGSESLQVTNLERTLVDIVVRPTYAGGPSQVLNAYRAAKDRVSIDALIAVLNRLDYAYPYHQAIGFLMQKAGYAEDSLAKLRTLEQIFDFYLGHKMQDPEYSEQWRLFYPRDLK